MINLLGTSTRSEINAAKRNVILRKYVFALLLLLTLVFGSFGAGYAMLAISKSGYDATIRDFNSQKDSYKDDIATAQQYSNNLKIAKEILSKDLSFTGVISTIASTLPGNVRLQEASLDSETLSKPIVFTLKLNNSDDAVTAKKALEKSPYFTDVKILKIDTQSTDKGTSTTASIETTLNTAELLKKQQGESQ